MEYEVNVVFPGSDGAEQSVADALEDPKRALSALGAKLSDVLMAMRPDRIAFSNVVGAESIEVEIAFAIEATGGPLLNLIVSPKGSTSCKAKLTWKRPKPPGESGATSEEPAGG